MIYCYLVSGHRERIDVLTRCPGSFPACLNTFILHISPMLGSCSIKSFGDTFNEPHNVRPNTFQFQFQCVCVCVCVCAPSWPVFPIPRPPLDTPKSCCHTAIIARPTAAVVMWRKQALGTNIPLFINVLMGGKIIPFFLLPTHPISHPLLYELLPKQPQPQPQWTVDALQATSLSLFKW